MFPHFLWQNNAEKCLLSNFPVELPRCSLCLCETINEDQPAQTFTLSFPIDNFSSNLHYPFVIFADEIIYI